MSHNRIRLPKSRFGRTLLSLAVTAAVGFGYFYVTLPALNPHAGEFYSFLGLLCAVYVVCVFLLSGAPHDNVIRTPKEKLREWLKFIKSRCLPVGLLFVAVVVIAAVGNVVSMPLLRAAAAEADITDIAQKNGQLIFTLEQFRLEPFSLLCGGERYRNRLLLIPGDVPRFTLRLRKGDDPLRCAQNLVEDYARAYGEAD